MSRANTGTTTAFTHWDSITAHIRAAATHLRSESMKVTATRSIPDTTHPVELKSPGHIMILFLISQLFSERRVKVFSLTRSRKSSRHTPRADDIRPWKKPAHLS
ncbi:unnamed protein product, partial [Lymnaea stagnalis]